MRNITRTALMLAALVFPSLCVAQTKGQSDSTPPTPPAPSAEYNPKAWKEVVSKEGRFSVMMPAEAKPDRREIETALGKLPSTMYSAMTGVGGYAAGFTDFPKHSEDPEYLNAVLNGARDKVLSADSSRKLLSEREVNIEGFSAREWLIADNSLLFRAETFLAKGRLYQLLLVVPLNVAFNNGRASTNAADRTTFYEDISKKFFGSFKLLTPGAAQSAPAPPSGPAAAPAGRRVKDGEE